MEHISGANVQVCECRKLEYQMIELHLNCFYIQMALFALFSIDLNYLSFFSATTHLGRCLFLSFVRCYEHFHCVVDVEPCSPCIRLPLYVL